VLCAFHECAAECSKRDVRQAHSTHYLTQTREYAMCSEYRWTGEWQVPTILQHLTEEQVFVIARRLKPGKRICTVYSSVQAHISASFAVISAAAEL